MNHISEAARPGSNKLRTCRRMPRQSRDWALDRLRWRGCICGNRPTRAKHGLNGRKNVDDDDDDGMLLFCSGSGVREGMQVGGHSEHGTGPVDAVDFR